MDFGEITKKLKKSALVLKKEAEKQLDSAKEFTAKKIADSSYTISSEKELTKSIENTKSRIKKTGDGESKTLSPKLIAVFGEEKSDFFADAILELPLLITKTLGSLTAIKLVNVSKSKLDLGKYKVKSLPSLALYENEKLVKIIEGKENVEKIIKNLSIDIVTNIKDFNS